MLMAAVGLEPIESGHREYFHVGLGVAFLRHTPFSIATSPTAGSGHSFDSILEVIKGA